MSADSGRSMEPGGQDHAFDWEMAALPAAEEPTWCADDADDTQDIDDPAWAAPGLQDPSGDGPARGLPGPHDPPGGDVPQGAPFAEGGWADALAPDPVLATLVDLVCREGLGKLDDDQLTGVLQAANRLAAWSAALRLAAASGLVARREAAGQATGDWRPFDHVDDEVAVALTLTRRSAGRLLDLAAALDRLPLTRAALAAGLIDERRAEVIAEETCGLDDAHAAAVEKLIIGRAPGLTSGQLRALVRRVVLSADPKAARRRKEEALKDARVELFPETSGTAALAGRDLPPAAVLAADKHLTALAQARKAAGQPGTLDILRAWAYLHLLSGQAAATLLPATTGGGAGSGGPGSPPSTAPGQSSGGPGTGPHFPAASGSTAPDAPAPGPGTPGSGCGGAAAGAPGPGSGAPATGGFPAPTGLRGSVNLTMPLSAWLGWTQSPGDVPGYGPLDAEDSRALAGLLARGPANQWCVTLTGPAGHPVAHACARQGPPGSPGRPGARAGPHPATPVPDWLRGLTFTTLQTTGCTHPRESPGYRPGPALRHLITIRNPTCTGPGCRRPAIRCDLDHVIPYGRGGRTCECNTHPACRHDHHTKQVPGWTVTQPEPGTLIWTTPGNRAHTTTPAQYWE